MNKIFLIIGAIAVAVLIVVFIALIVVLAKGKGTTEKNKQSKITEKANLPAEQKQQPNLQTNEAEEQTTKKTSKSTQPKQKKQTAQKETSNEPVKQKEEAASEPQPETEEKVKAQKYMITYDKEEKLWVVKKTNAKKASKKFKTKAEAYLYAERLSEERGMALTVKKKDGKFQKAANAKKSVK